ncbi:TPA: hypothetical protein ACU8BP_000539 [Neisseria subflava]|uniref:hypothetical protein n=1 Tax=Neisseria subflava TaxID=28449 RepID=UPI000D31143C|nr:hypothetical protein [Neisseria subflava]
MAWRAYYTLKDAANELSKQLNDSFEVNDIIHYGAIGLTEFCIQVSTMRFFKRSLAERYFPEVDNPLIIERYLFNGYFAPIHSTTMQEIEIKKSAKVSVFPYLMNIDGEHIKAAPERLQHLSINPAFENYTIRIPKPTSETIEYKTPQEVIDAVNENYGQRKGPLYITNFQTEGWFFQYIPNEALADFTKVEGYQSRPRYPDRDFLESNKWSITVTTDTLRLTSKSFNELKEVLSEKMKIQKSISKRTENKQAEIIAALSAIYTKTDCSKPYEAAETIIQEWERQADKLGKPPTGDTLAKYIKQGIDRLSQ